MYLAPSNIYVSCDLWTSENSLIFVAILAYFIWENNLLEITFICFHYVISLHSEKVIVEQVVNIITKYNMKDD